MSALDWDPSRKSGLSREREVEFFLFDQDRIRRWTAELDRLTAHNLSTRGNYFYAAEGLLQLRVDECRARIAADVEDWFTTRVAA